MPRERRKRIDFHPTLVIAKAASGTCLFYDQEDYASYLCLLRQLVRDRLITVFAYCLKDDEIRLILTSDRLSLGRVIQRLHGAHTLRVNARVKRQGSLFRGRYQSIPFSKDELANAVRAVHLWPVRVGIVKRPEFFQFSSHSSYLGRGLSLADFIEIKWIENEFGSPLYIAQKAFGKFVEEAALDADGYGIGAILKDPITDPESPKRQAGFLNGLAKRISLSFSINLAHLKGPSRRQDLVMARRLMATIAVLDAHRSVTEVADFLCRDKAQVSRLVSQGMDLLEADTPFKTLYESVWQEKNRALNHE